ncbi:MAG: DUF1273 family protein [Clostridia bacterium]|nr:DUF1273 family protein [Clostridia bacterium]
MKTCVFFGHRSYDYERYKGSLRKICKKLIEEEGVERFYAGARGDFDRICRETLLELKREYPHVKLTLFLSYLPKTECKPIGYDDTEYVLDRKVYPKYAIAETNKAVVEKSDFVVVGVFREYGGAYAAACYAKRRGKTIIPISE